MKLLKLFFTITAFSMMVFKAGASVPVSASSFTGYNALPSFSKKQQRLSFMKWFVQLSPKEYGRMRGKKLNFFEKASFKITQYRMKQQLRRSGSDQTDGTNWAGAALGFFLGPLGVLGAYIFSKDKNFIKWTWIGCGILIALSLLIIIL